MLLKILLMDTRKNLLVTETEKRKALESKIGKAGDAFTKNKQAYDDGVGLAGLAMSGRNKHCNN